MNSIDYSYGGGEGRMLGGCFSVMFWGVYIKGKCMCNNKCID